MLPSLISQIAPEAYWYRRIGCQPVLLVTVLYKLREVRIPQPTEPYLRTAAAGKHFKGRCVHLIRVQHKYKLARGRIAPNTKVE